MWGMRTQQRDNSSELELLRNDPRGFLLAVQDIIEIIVRKFILSGLFGPRDHDDIVQTINEELLKKLPVISARYNGKALLRTYVSAIIRNICLKMHERQLREPVSVPLGESVAADPEEFRDTAADGALLIRVRRTFRAILQQYDYRDQLPQLRLYLKLRYRIRVTSEDILSWHPRCSLADRKQILSVFGGKYEEMEEKEIYRVITPIANKAQGKQNSEDAARKWLRTRLDEILELLNGSGKTAFDEDSLGILVEDYFSPFLRA